jgi:hypothetical protein
MADTTISQPVEATQPAQAHAAAVPTDHVSRRDVALALLFTSIVLIATLLLYGSSFEGTKKTDFGARYASGLMLREGYGPQLYNLEEQTRVQRELFDRATPLPEDHPPFEILLYEPLSRLTFLQAYFVWGLFNVAIWMASVYLLRASVPVPRQNLRFLLLCFTFFPLWLTLHGGQTSMLMLLSYSLALFHLKRRRAFATGASLGLGLFKFHLVLPFVLICALRGKWRLIAGFVAVAAVLAGISALVVGPGGLAQYAALLVYIARHPGDPSFSPIPVWDMPTLRGFLTAIWGGALRPEWISALTTPMTLGLLVFTAWRWRKVDRRRDERGQDLMFAAALVVTLLTSFHLFANDLGALLPAIFLALGAVPWSRPSRWHILLAISVGILYLPFVYLLLSDKLFLLCPILVAFVVTLFGLRSAAPLSEPTVTG